MQTVYSDSLIHHSKNPFHYYALTNYHARYHSQNPLCGDDITIYLRAKDEHSLEEASFQGQCCTVCRSSASIMMQSISGQDFKNIRKTIALSETLRQTPFAASQIPDLSNLWQTLKDFPVRHKCASFPWDTLKKALTELGPIDLK